MAIKATGSTRAPRGTKILTQAFFNAASDIPDAQRPIVVKAALAAIRDELKENREKAKVAKARASTKIVKAAPPRAAKAAKAAPKPAPMIKKIKAKPGPKPKHKPMADTSTESAA